MIGRDHGYNVRYYNRYWWYVLGIGGNSVIFGSWSMGSIFLHGVVLHILVGIIDGSFWINNNWCSC